MKTSSINLLTKDDFSSTSLGEISAWALSVGRWIVIVTEIIVITAFLARFKLDRDIANLTEEINQKIAIVKAYAPFEEKFRETQKRLSLVNEALDQQKNYDSIFNEVDNSLPPDVNLSKIDVQENNLTISAVSLTETGMAGMQAKLQQSKLFQKVNLIKVDIEEGSDDGIHFEIRAQFASQTTF